MGATTSLFLRVTFPMEIGEKSGLALCFSIFKTLL